ncbi:hypothetical protein [Actinomadura violacea]|uniref:Uncharacterized protein n=1 Tax=Actinomadura violacea TaxID=2819934 RepID=A0ABS3S4U0_9ACTN|nr:hypothetical protein [Actinomadura violacea]MBO2464008.1 hypothetical protein [Actinomadura violacea]
MPTPTASHAGLWLADSDDDRDHALRWWTNTGTAVMPAGRAWDAVGLPEGLGRQAVKALPNGPAIHYPEHEHIVILVPPGTAATWDADEAGYACLGDGFHVNVPEPSRTSSPGPYWLRSPGPCASFADSTALLRLIATAHKAARFVASQTSAAAAHTPGSGAGRAGELKAGDSP